MRRIVVVLSALVAIAALGIGQSGLASAAGGCMHRFGSLQRTADAGGVQEWTVSDLTKSTDPTPGYPLAGELWEASASVTAINGATTPIIPGFTARTGTGVTYPVQWQLASPRGIPGATITEGQTASGKLYFDVTGGDPVAVTYAGGGAPLMWCCSAGMMAMPMQDCPCCTSPQPCPCCAGKMGKM